MRRFLHHHLDRLVLVCSTLALVTGLGSAEAQDPILIPGRAGAGLPAGASTAGPSRSFSDLLDIFDSTSTVPSETAAPQLPEFGVTGDWWGARTTLADAGLDFRGYASQFYQGIPSGGLEDGFLSGTKLDYFGTIDAEKLFGWEGLFVNLHGESRFGQSVNGNLGSIIPANFALQFPQPDGSATVLTNLSFEKFITPNFVVTFGKLNAADGVNIHPFLGGNGIDRFMNELFVLNAIYGRTIPYSGLGAGFSYLRDNDPIFTILVYDTNSPIGTSGFENLFSNGATLFAHLRIPVTPFGLLGHQSLDGAYATGTSSPLSKDDYLSFSPPTIAAAQQTGSWVVTYGFDQFLFVRSDAPNKGWGLFGSISFADAQTNPMQSCLLAGVGGTSPVPHRESDSYGVGYYFVEVSPVLRQLMNTVSPLHNEQGVELYYTAQLTRWFTLTADMQVIDPAQRQSSLATVCGLRAKISF